MVEPIRVGSIDDIDIGEAFVVAGEDNATGEDIAIVHAEDDGFYAINDICTHQYASLAQGWVEGVCIECPVHSSQFDLRTGKVSGPPATRDTVVHRLEVVDNDLMLYAGEPPAPDTQVS